MGEMDALTFYRGLLFAIRAWGADSFPASGPRFHRAFKSAVEFAKGSPPGPDIKIGLSLDGDRAFGTYDEAESLLLEGEMDLILHPLSPPPRRARFKIDQREAESELVSLGHKDWFMGVAARFLSQRQGERQGVGGADGARCGQVDL